MTAVCMPGRLRNARVIVLQFDNMTQDRAWIAVKKKKALLLLTGLCVHTFRLRRTARGGFNCKSVFISKKEKVMNGSQPDKPSRTSGPNGGRVSGCPDTPNCVSSESTDEAHMIAPLPVGSANEGVFDCLRAIVSGMDRVTVLATDQENIKAEFRSLLGFVDDVEFQLDRENGAIQMRSAARVGYWDFGVNRRRLEGIRKKFDRECGVECGSKEAHV
jgi:uncharacterized protein (DUF1499 family)